MTRFLCNTFSSKVVKVDITKYIFKVLMLINYTYRYIIYFFLSTFILPLVIGTELDKGLSGRLVWSAGASSSMKTTVSWSRNNHSVSATLKVID